MPRVIEPEVVASAKPRVVTAPNTAAPSATNPTTSGTAPAGTSQTAAVDVSALRGRQDFLHANGVLAARLGEQADGKVGLRLWNSLGVLQQDWTYT